MSKKAKSSNSMLNKSKSRKGPIAKKPASSRKGKVPGGRPPKKNNER